MLNVVQIVEEEHEFEILKSCRRKISCDVEIKFTISFKVGEQIWNYRFLIWDFKVGTLSNLGVQVLIYG